jgi:predicted ATP-grasp superfamily ATP-dependent carboligase
VEADSHLLIVGASVRAAAFSALRAGLRPWCVDLFADADLRAVCPAHRLEGRYPESLTECFDRAPSGPWMYTGGLENHPGLVRRLARARQLWGNDGDVLRKVRDPFVVARLLREAGSSVPEVLRPGKAIPPEGRWLIKPGRGAGGQGIRFHTADATVPPASYVQRHVEGESRAVLYVADDSSTQLLGMTRQLVGEEWLHASPFHYCGSVGPLSLTLDQQHDLERLGEVLARGCGLRGLFGIDGVWRDGVFWPVEINPRYTASVEVLERAMEIAALAWHRRAFEATTLPPAPSLPHGSVVGKAILFARRDLIFPEHLTGKKFADIPDPGERIPMGRPILSFFTRGGSVDECQTALRRMAVDLDRELFGG